MKIIEMNATFGCLNKATLRPGDGFTLVEASNESGKSNLTTIGGSAFCRSGVERIELPEGVQVVKWNAFQYAKQLQYISFPSTLTTMGSSILFYATSLTEIYFHPDCTITAFSSMSPVSRPTSIIMVVMPVCFSPSMTHHWMPFADADRL